MGRSLNDKTVNFLRFSLWTHIRLTIIECTGPRQRNDTSLVFIGCVILELQLFFLLLCGLVQRNTVPPLPEMHESRTIVSREPCNV